MIWKTYEIQTLGLQVKFYWDTSQFISSANCLLLQGRMVAIETMCLTKMALFSSKFYQSLTLDMT